MEIGLCVSVLFFCVVVAVVFAWSGVFDLNGILKRDSTSGDVDREPEAIMLVHGCI